MSGLGNGFTLESWTDKNGVHVPVEKNLSKSELEELKQINAHLWGGPEDDPFGDDEMDEDDWEDGDEKDDKFEYENE